jgi:hypothetical protein
MSDAVLDRSGLPASQGASRIRVIRSVVYLVIAAWSVVIAVLFARHGIRVDTFPPYVAGDTETRIRQFSGPWIAGAFGLVALAGLLIVAAVADLRPRIELPPEEAPPTSSPEVAPLSPEVASRGPAPASPSSTTAGGVQEFATAPDPADPDVDPVDDGS